MLGWESHYSNLTNDTKQEAISFLFAKYILLSEGTPGPMVVSSGRQTMPFSHLGLCYTYDKSTDQLPHSSVHWLFAGCLGRLKPTQYVFSIMEVLHLVCKCILFTSMRKQHIASLGKLWLMTNTQAPQNKRLEDSSLQSILWLKKHQPQ